MQQDFSVNNKRMAKNTLFMYFRMIVLILVQLYTVPIVLSSLGVEDYGIYQVVAGFVIMFGFVNGSLVSGCQRFISYAIGEKDDYKLKKTFDVTYTIFLCLSIILFAIIEIVGYWFLNYQMTIPEGRLFAANCVFQFALLAFVLRVFVTPFNSTVIAHEHMSVFAYVSIAEAIMKLIIALCLTIMSGDLLIFYSFLLFLSTFAITAFYYFYNKNHFAETSHIRLLWDNSMFKDMGSYAGWNVIGALAITLRNQGLNIVMNLFFGPLLNAAHAIASQINGIFGQLVNNVYMATRPQIVKQYAQNNKDEMWNIIFKSSKYSFFLMMFISIPFLLEIDVILNLWLKDVPEYTVVITRCLIIASLIETLSNQIIGGFQAANKIKHYQSVSSVILLSVIPLAYLGLLYNNNPIIPYMLSITVSIAYAVSIIYIATKKIHLDYRAYINEVLTKSLVPFAIAMLSSVIVASFLNEGITRFILISLFSISISIVSIWLAGLNNIERSYIVNLLKNKIARQ